MLYIIGLGLNEKGISREGIEKIEKSDKVYLENYTIDFPYEAGELGLSESTIKLSRGEVESAKLIEEAKNERVALLVYGAPLFATTHMTLVLEAKKAGVKVRIIQSASIFDAIAETGLQLYKFGKISSMPTWTKSFKADSFLDYVIQNQKIGAHSLILVDIGLKLEDALKQLKESCKNKELKLDKIIVCKKLGTKKSKTYYGTLEELKKKNVPSPYCFVVPGEMHFLEKEAVEMNRVKDK
jgi:diphthine synthase